MRLLTLAITCILTLGLAGCAKGGNGQPPANKDKAGETGGGPIAGGGGGGLTPGEQNLSRQPWCANFDTAQLRFVLGADRKFVAEQYALENGMRGEVQGRSQGTWKLIDATIEFNVDGQKLTYPIRLDPSGPTGAPQLHVTAEDGSQTTYDPCM